jgi:oligoribonuclease NrnB/cAMP/cGMP phosphodiesterase (DHH superfamily)
MISVLYHGNCADGFGAAWAAWKCFGDAAQYRPVQYGSPLPEIADGSEVFILDFSYPRATLDALAARCDLHVLDHHKTAAAALASAPYARFDMDKSGAVLTWEALHGTPVPLLLQYVQDRDLWRWALPDSREVSAALWAYPMEFALWDQVATAIEDYGISDLVLEGCAIRRYMEQQTAMICDQSRLEPVGGWTVPVVNATSLWSEVGEELLRRYPDAAFAASYYDLGNGLRKWSLRSEDHREDVSAVAKAQGGGGHRNAAGFEQRR